MAAEEVFLHELRYRGDELLAKFAQSKLVICGAGALGGNLAENLCRQGFKSITVIDRDRIEAHNINTQPYGKREVGGFKVKILAGNLFRSLGVAIQAYPVELTTDNVGKLLRGAELVVDTFDNSASRQLVKDWCEKHQIPCFHVGMSGDGYGEGIWSEEYRVPKDVGQDICDYPLARNLVIFVMTLASEVIIKFLFKGVKENFAFTLEDKKIQIWRGGE